MIDNLKKNIKRLLADQSLSANALEKRAGLKASAVQNILHGRSKKPSIDVIASIAKELNCSVEDLMGEGSVSSEKDVLSSQSFELSVIEAICPILFDELKKFNPTIDKSLLMKLLEEIHSYVLKLPNKDVNKAFIEWIVESFLSQTFKRW